MARAIQPSRRLLLLAGALLLACEGTRAAAPPGNLTPSAGVSAAVGAADGVPGSARVAAPEDGYELWLRYRLVADAARLAEYREAAQAVVTLGEQASATLGVARDELTRGLTGLLGAVPASARAVERDGSVVLGSLSASPALASLPFAAALAARGPDAYVVQAVELSGRRVLAVAGNTDRGVLYGTFALLRALEQHAPLTTLPLTGAPRIRRRVLNHWDNLDGSIERGYAGRSLWDWESLPGGDHGRYVDYARANASLGINGAVLNNVNASAQILTQAYIGRVRALADIFRPYGIAVYLTARFSAPIEIGGLKTADPLAPEVRRWWRDKATEIYAEIPDFGGFLVKANSEGQPGPREYGRSHADGANMLAEALAPHGGVVMWRAFVYDSGVPTDRVRQAYDEFHPLDGQFAANAFVQVKNGPLDFQPREPFHPLFGAMPKTPLVLELQITKEYLGQDTHVAYLGPLYEEVLDADTFAAGPGSSVARVIDGSLEHHGASAIAGAANVGSDRNWCGSHMNQANWYVYGRMSWDPDLSAAQVAEEWVRQTFSNEAAVVQPVTKLLMRSREAVVDYMTPLGLTHVMASHHHYGPGPWVDDLGRADWNPVYYHRADARGVGFDRTASGSNALGQYAAPVRDAWASRARVPDNLLLFFHHVGWDEPLRSGRTLWHELVERYGAGVDAVAAMRAAWESLRGRIDEPRFSEVQSMLRIQQYEARWWRDASLAYFSQVSGHAIPDGYDQPLFPLSFYRALPCPPDRTRPRCEPVYVEPPAPSGAR